MDATAVPLDVIDSIVDQLSNDIIALKQCSLVSHHFLAPTRRHLFSTIKLDGRVSLPFRSLLQNNRSLATHVRRLEITEGVESDGKNWLTIQSETLISVLHILRIHGYVKSFSWDFWPGKSLARTYFNTLPSELQSTILQFLRSPYLMDIFIGHLQYFPVSYFTECSQLKRLTLHSVFPPTEPYAPGQEVQWSPEQLERGSGSGKLETLIFGDLGRNARSLVEALTSPHSSLSLASLRFLSVQKNVDSELIRIVTTAAGPSLESFVWTANRTRNHTTIPLILGWNSGVKSLILGTTTQREHVHEDPLYWLLPSLKSVITEHALEELSIQIENSSSMLNTNRAEELEEYYLWGGLDSLLTRPVFSRLRSVKIHLGTLYTGSHNLVHPVQVVRSRLPLLNAAGILETKAIVYKF